MLTKQSKVRRDRPDAAAPATADDIEEQRERLYEDVERRRLKEWDNHQRSHRADEDQNPNRAFIDVALGDALLGRLVVELFDDTVPLTVAHFRAFLTGSGGLDLATGTKLDYLHCPLVNVGAGGGALVFGSMGRDGGGLRDESFTRRHTQRGLLTMMSRGPHMGGFAFGVTLGPAPDLDFRQVIFGRVVDGLPLLEKLEGLPVDVVGRPLVPVTITLCGVLSGERPSGTWQNAAARGTGDDENDAEVEE